VGRSIQSANQLNHWQQPYFRKTQGGNHGQTKELDKLNDTDKQIAALVSGLHANDKQLADSRNHAEFWVEAEEAATTS
jgi:hypothetical protein